MKLALALIMTVVLITSITVTYAVTSVNEILINPVITTTPNTRGDLPLKSNCATGCSIIGDFHFYGNNTSGVQKEYALIEAYADNLNPGIEEGRIRFISLHGGTPISYLEFNNGGNNQVFSFVDFAVAAGKKLMLDSGGGSEWLDRVVGTNTIRIASGGTPAITIDPTKVVITSGHKLGVNTSTPSEELDVVGDIKLSGNIVSSGAIKIIPNGDVCIGTGC